MLVFGVLHGPVAQWSEQRPLKPRVEGSNPSRPSTLRQGFVWQATKKMRSVSPVALAKGGCNYHPCIMSIFLELNDGSIYTGSTGDLQKRVLKHNKGDVLATKGKRPVKLIYYCSFLSKSQVLKFEQYLKTGSGQAFRNKHLA